MSTHARAVTACLHVWSFQVACSRAVPLQPVSSNGQWVFASKRHSCAVACRRTRSMAGRQPSFRGVSRQPSMVSRAASIAGFEDDYGGDCGICLDEQEQVAINGCNHRLCVDCSISLCEIHKKPPLCPFCRSMISGFHALPKNKYHVN